MFVMFIMIMFKFDGDILSVEVGLFQVCNVNLPCDQTEGDVGYWTIFCVIES